jgi:hypothetical protein
VKKLNGPDLKMPSLKTPDFLMDLYYDLRDRRLLPVVALVVVAIAAVPFLLGEGEETYVPPAGSGLAALGSSTERTSKLTVVEATPGLRDYRKRLKDRTPTDPFKQRYTGLPKSAQVKSSDTGSEASGSGSSAVTVTESGTTEASSGATSGGSGSGKSPGASGGSSGGGSPSAGGDSNGGKPHLVIFDYAIDAWISYSPPAADASAQQREPFVERRILPQTAIPGEKAPVVTYLGPGRNKDNRATGKVLLLVSGDVGQIDGEHRCVSSRSSGLCQLLEVEPDFPLTFAYGEAGAHYTIKVLDIELVVTGHT